MQALESYSVSKDTKVLENIAVLKNFDSELNGFAFKYSIDISGLAPENGWFDSLINRMDGLPCSKRRLSYLSFLYLMFI